MYISRLKCEISAQEKLLLNSKQYQLTDKEVEQTKNALTAYRNELKNFKNAISCNDRHYKKVDRQAQRLGTNPLTA